MTRISCRAAMFGILLLLAASCSRDEPPNCRSQSIVVGDRALVLVTTERETFLMSPYPMYRSTEEVVYGVVQASDGSWLAGRLDDGSPAGRRAFVEGLLRDGRSRSGCAIEAHAGSGTLTGRLSVREGREGHRSTYVFSCAL